MNVLLVCECTKRALAETRRILDQFAERRGERTWQTPITQAGLDTLRRLLRKTARKNTAVACHWIRGLDHSELLWIVGDASRFNAEGAAPTNTTTRDLLRREDENDWHSGEDIALLAQMAALLHDLGKASIAFQERLEGKRTERNLYRHEWVSLRLFQAFVGEDDDEGWLRRLADADMFDEKSWLAEGQYQRDGLNAADKYPFRNLLTKAPLAAAIAWLIVTHHRLPAVPVDNEKTGTQYLLGRRSPRFDRAWLETPLAQVAHDWNEIRAIAPLKPAQIEPYWQPADSLPVMASSWRAQAARVAKRLLKLCPRSDRDWFGNPYVMHLARLCLMLADHHYSSLGFDNQNKPVTQRKPFIQSGQSINANTTRNQQGHIVSNQSLLEHLLGVGHVASLIAHALPGFERHLPRIASHRGLRKRSADSRFAWQDKAFDAAAGLREAAHARGAFIVNMASTGCGKTLANARILYALADPQQGLRATYALGLRTLTLQTAHSYRTNLHLDDDKLAVLVGGSASRELFAFYEHQAEAHGSASAQALIEEDSFVYHEGNIDAHPMLSRAIQDSSIRSLVSAPMVVCTVDHIMPATESLRAGRQIAPMLRLMSADLVLDELDDYDLNDLPALTRLVHWAGMLGSRVILSSATLPPALVQGMFMAYRAGRSHHHRNRGCDGGNAVAPPEIPCLWVDEFGVQAKDCADAAAFGKFHTQGFIGKRVEKLEAAEPLRLAELMPLEIASGLPKESIRARFAQHVLDACLRLHGDHAGTDPVSGKRVSFGIVRMANIDPLFDVAKALFELGAPDDTHIHLCVYHARFPLAQRSAIEHQLDSAFNRRGDGQAVYHLLTIRNALDAYSEHNHLFIVLASPVCEVGRDWDADWAVAEPSSMRALIQLAGRVQRHRRKPPKTANVLVFDTNLRHHEQPGNPAYVKPGFEKETQDNRFLLATHSLKMLMADDEYRHLDAIARIHPRSASDRQPRERWVDLEQARIEAAMLPVEPTPVAPISRRRSTPVPTLERDQAPPAWQYPQAALTGVLPQQQPFREDNYHDATLAFLPGEDVETLAWYRVEDDMNRIGQQLYVPARELVQPLTLTLASGIGSWGYFELTALLVEQAESLNRPLSEVARTFSVVEVPPSDQGWFWHPWLGFKKEK